MSFLRSLVPDVPAELVAFVLHVDCCGDRVRRKRQEGEQLKANHRGHHAMTTTTRRRRMTRTPSSAGGGWRTCGVCRIVRRYVCGVG